MDLDNPHWDIKWPFVGYSFVANEGEYAAEAPLPHVGYSFVANEGNRDVYRR